MVSAIVRLYLLIVCQADSSNFFTGIGGQDAKCFLSMLLISFLSVMLELPLERMFRGETREENPFITNGSIWFSILAQGGTPRPSSVLPTNSINHLHNNETLYCLLAATNPMSTTLLLSRRKDLLPISQHSSIFPGEARVHKALNAA